MKWPARIALLVAFAIPTESRAQAGSAPVVAIDLVKAKPGQRERLIRFYKANWDARRFEALARGMISDYRMLVSADTGTRWDVMLETTYRDSASYEARERNFGELIARNPAKPVDGMMRAELGDIVESRNLTLGSTTPKRDESTILQFACASGSPCANRGLLWDAENVIPRYPALLQSVGITGNARVAFAILADGRVDSASVRVVETINPAFGRAVSSAVQAWRFRPWGGVREIPVLSPEVAVEFGFALRCAPGQGASVTGWFPEESPPRLVVLACPVLLVPRDQ